MYNKKKTICVALHKKSSFIYTSMSVVYETILYSKGVIVCASLVFVSLVLIITK